MRTSLLATAITLCAVAQVPSQAPDGAAIYRENCRACHGPTGVPPRRMVVIYKELAPLDSAFLAGRSEDSLVAVLRNGIGQMKSFKEKLSPDQMLTVARYVQTFGTLAATPKAP